MKPAPAKDAPLPTSAPPSPKDAAALLAVQQALSSIKFGVVQITVQDGRIVQIDKTEKIRLI